MKKIIFLDQSEMPKKFYNILHDLPEPLDPPLDPETKKPINPEKLERIFPKELVKQEMSRDEYVKIPEEVLELYKKFRPTPLIRATNLEAYLKTPARIYFKYEGVTPTGAHKVNTTLMQAYYAKEEGVKRIVAETGAGQFGSAVSYANSMFGIETTIYMVKISFEQKPYRKTLMKMYGAEVFPSPSARTKFGRMVLAKDPGSNGSLGIAVSEAIEDTLNDPNAKYSIGSVLNFVCLHQTIIGEEAKLQLAKAGEYPDIIIGCIGGGSNFAGISFPFIKDKLRGEKPNLRAIGVEPLSCASLTKGEFRYDYGDTAGMTPMVKMYTLGHDFMPSPTHSGGLRYHGMAPTVSLLYKKGIIEAQAYSQLDVFNAAKLFMKTEGYLPAPESAHAIKAVIEEALKAKEEGKEKVILFNLSGHGFLDLKGYESYLNGEFN